MLRQKQYFLALFLFLWTFFLQAAHPVSAHMVKSDNGIAAVFHVDPDDDPVVGSPSIIGVEITNAPATADWQNCQCNVEIHRDDELLGTIPLTTEIRDSGIIHVVADYVFPKKGIYTLYFKGSVPDGESNHSFSMEYYIRVTRENPQATKAASKSIPFFFQCCLGIAAAGIAIVSPIMFIRRRKV